jgi:hypothetical protein
MRKPARISRAHRAGPRMWDLALDYVPVTVVADIDLASLQGEGHLEIRGEQQTG